MKFTKSQQKIIDKFNELEKEYGKGNVFFRYANDCWKVVFAIHKKGDDKITLKLEKDFKVNGKIINSFQKLGILIPKNINHETIEDVNKTGHDSVLVGSTLEF